MRRIFALALLTFVGGGLLACAQAASVAAETGAPPVPAGHAAAPAPPNDELTNAQAITSLPATVNGTTVGATVVPSEPTGGRCEAGMSTSSVWYSFHASASAAQRIGVELAAQGNLDATINVFRVVRSELSEVECEPTGEEGKASLTFHAEKNRLYDIRVAARAGSQLAGFTLSVFLPTPAVTPPGTPLPASGASGHVDRIQNINAAYALTLHAGVSYLINLTNVTRHGACVTGQLFGPNTQSFEGASAVAQIQCSGYRLFTPGPGQGGRYSLELTPTSSFAGVQRFHVQVARAGPGETSPGIALPNYGVANGYLNGAGVQILRLYRLDVSSHSNLTLRLRAPSSAQFSVRLLDQNGDQLACACEGQGDQTVQHKLGADRYYVAVAVRGASKGSFTLERESRTITRTTIYFANASARQGRASAPDGRETPLRIHVSQGASGPVTVNVERFDPVFGWQFYRQLRTAASNGVASIPFTAPAVGQWRVNARYGGSRVSSPSQVGFSYLLVR